MSAAAVSRFLTDFAHEGGRDTAAGRGAAEVAAAKQATLKIEEAHTRGVEAGRTAARTEFLTEFAKQRTNFDRQLAAERQRWVAEEGARIADTLLAELRELEARIAETTARVLKPFLAAQLRERAIADLCADIEAVIGNDTGVGLHICGPADLMDAVRERLAGKPIAVTYAPGEGCDLRVSIGQATLETQLGGWMARLDEAAR